MTEKKIFQANVPSRVFNVINIEKQTNPLLVTLAIDIVYLKFFKIRYDDMSILFTTFRQNCNMFSFPIFPSFITIVIPGKPTYKIGT